MIDYKAFMKELKKLKLPIAYDHFEEGEVPNPPFLVYRVPKSDNLSADGIAYYKIDLCELELYCDKKDVALERKIEAWLDAQELFYEKTEEYIKSERYYLTEYLFSI